MTGLAKKGIHFGFLLEDSPGSIKEVADVIRKFGGRIASVLSSYERASKGHRHVYIRAYDVDRQHLTDLKQELRKASKKLLYMVDHKENTRERFL